MVGGSERQALKIVAEKGGEIGAHTVSRAMKVDPNYARMLLNSLARADYVDLRASGRYRITYKGKSELERKKETGFQ
ncbi:MAG: hypothetical protein ACE5JO_04930 [Candidatus Binatia bacterium]